MINLLEKLLSIIYIQPCYFCGSTKEDTLMCSKCYAEIKFLPPAVLTKIQGIDIYSAALYDGVIKKLIKSLKYYNKKKLAFYQAKIMFDYWQKLNIKGDFIILPVPIHKNRLKERKYNHMDLTAEEFAKLSNYKINKKFLVRIKDTKKQYNLHKSERIQNIKNAFNTDDNYAPEKTTGLLILDDITSTGITLEEIIKVLKQTGYNNITALTLATPDIWN